MCCLPSWEVLWDFIVTLLKISDVEHLGLVAEIE